MVTTNSTDQIRSLLEEAIRKITSLADDVQQDEAELEVAAFDVLDRVIRLIVPVLPYIDGEIKVKWVSGSTDILRGIDLTGRGDVLLRDGGLNCKDQMDNHSPYDYIAYFEQDLLGQHAEYKIDFIITVVERLAGVFGLALEKIDERRKAIESRQKKLTAAAEIFQAE